MDPAGELLWPFSFLFFIFFLSSCVYLERERGRENLSRGGAEREGGRTPGRLLGPSAEPVAGPEPTKCERRDHESDA